jgi:hypothetical protein
MIKKTIFQPLPILFLVCLYGIALGLVKQQNQIAMVKHTYLISCSVIAFIFGKHLYPYVNKKNFNRIISITLLTNFIAAVLFIIIQSIYPIYSGYGHHAISYVAMYNMVMKKKLLFTLSLIILIAQGLRGIMIVTLFCIYFYHSLTNVKYKKLMYLGLILLPFFSLALLYLIEDMNLYTLPGLGRMASINPFSDQFDLFKGSSGRMDEVLNAMDVFNSNLFNYFFGAGFGFTYDWQVSYEASDIEENKCYLHITPITLFILLGPIALFVYGYFIFLAIRGIKNANFAGNREQCDLAKFFSISGLFFILSGTFSLNLISDLTGATCLGLTYGFLSKLEKRGNSSGQLLRKPF